jgi:hypothetical protein
VVDKLLPSESWSLGDWAINYEGGFLRRGLTGQAFYLIAHALHTRLFPTIFLAMVGVSFVVGWAFFHLTRGIVWELWMVLLIASPATLSFSLFNPGRAMHKEILYLAVLGVYAVLVLRRPHSVWLSAVFLPCAWLVLILSHEASFLYGPYLLAALLVGSKLRYKLPLALAVSLLAGAVFLVVVKHPGTPAQALAVCKSIGGTDLRSPLCNGAISALGGNSSLAHREVLEFLQQVHPRYTFVFIIALALLPIFMALRSLRRTMPRECTVMAACTVLAWIGTVPLFYLAIDWDRWIYIHSMSCALLLLLIANQRQEACPQEHRQIIHSQGLLRVAAIAFIVAYLGAWQCSQYYHFPEPAERLGHFVRIHVHGPRPSLHGNYLSNLR